MSFDPPVLRVPLIEELLRDRLLEVLEQRSVDMRDVLVVPPPFIESQSLLLCEERLEQLDVRRVRVAIYQS